MLQAKGAVRVILKTPKEHFLANAKMSGCVFDQSTATRKGEAGDGVATGIPSNGEDGFVRQFVFM